MVIAEINQSSDRTIVGVPKAAEVRRLADVEMAQASGAMEEMGHDGRRDEAFEAGGLDAQRASGAEQSVYFLVE